MIAARTLVRYNTLAGLLVLLAHGGGAIALYLSESPDANDFVPFALVSGTLAIVIIASGALALFERVSMEKVLRQQTVILLAGAAILLGWMGFIAVTGIPAGRFALNPVMFVVVVAYPFYLLRQTFLFDHIDLWYVEKIHLIVGSVAGIIAAVLMYRLFAYI